MYIYVIYIYDHELPAVPHGEDPHIASRQKYIPQQKK